MTDFLLQLLSVPLFRMFLMSVYPYLFHCFRLDSIEEGILLVTSIIEFMKKTFISNFLVLRVRQLEKKYFTLYMLFEITNISSVQGFLSRYQINFHLKYII